MWSTLLYALSVALLLLVVSVVSPRARYVLGVALSAVGLMLWYIYRQVARVLGMSPQKAPLRSAQQGNKKPMVGRRTTSAPALGKKGL